MKIGLNASFFPAFKGGGIERAIRCLVSSLGRIAKGHDFVLFSGRGNAGTFELPGNFSEHFLPLNPENRVSRVFFEQAVLPVLVKREKIEVLISPGNMAALFAPCQEVLILHDCVPWAESACYGALHRTALKALFLLSARRAERIVVPSRFSRAEAVRHLGVAPERMMVAPESGEHLPFFSDERNPPGGFILCISSAAAHKNADGLLAAYAVLRRDFGVKIPLVMVGVAEKPGNSGVVFRKTVSEKCLHALYSWAALAVAPSFYEGFGLAAAEAMQAGTPLAVSRIPALVETTGGAAMYFDPRDPLDMARAINAILCDSALSERLAAAGRKRAESLRWDDFALKVMKAVKSCLEKKPA
ncbi:MAG: glycosyltransferase family 4 protein [Deltaproteobacteria bacterium]|nr:glycosyltransferase family 4 protein [Deltaproteobacteria bacterium]